MKLSIARWIKGIFSLLFLISIGGLFPGLLFNEYVIVKIREKRTKDQPIVGKILDKTYESYEKYELGREKDFPRTLFISGFNTYVDKYFILIDNEDYKLKVVYYPPKYKYKTFLASKETVWIYVDKSTYNNARVGGEVIFIQDMIRDRNNEMEMAAEIIKK